MGCFGMDLAKILYERISRELQVSSKMRLALDRPEKCGPGRPLLKHLIKISLLVEEGNESR